MERLKYLIGNWHELVPHLPFVTMAVMGANGKSKAIVAWREIIVSLITAGIIAFFGSYITVEKIGVKMDYMARDINTALHEQQTIRMEIQKVKEDIWEHRAAGSEKRR